MARMKSPSYIKQPGGRMDDIVIYSIGDRSYFRKYVVPRNPDTEKQRIVRRTFSDAVKSWQQLSAEEKASFNKLAGKYNRKGYNLYISMYVNDSLPVIHGKAAGGTAQNTFIPPMPLRTHTVAAASGSHYRSGTPGINRNFHDTSCCLNRTHLTRAAAHHLP